MRPDLSLTNPAQNKTFTGTGATTANKKFIVHPFHAGKKRTAKPFAGWKNLHERQFITRTFPRAKATARVGSARTNRTFPTAQSGLVRTPTKAGKAVQTRQYPDSRRFLVQGTRQKLLNQQNQPLTIDEVRELLNKNR